MRPHSPRTTDERLTKLLVKVTIQGSIGPVQLVMSPANTVGQLMKAVLEVYGREKRRPLMCEMSDSSCFELHYSAFSLESLDVDEKLINLGSRNFFMCRKPNSKSNMVACSEQRSKSTLRFQFLLVKLLMDILL